MTKIEWEKCAISQFLDVIPKLFQIRRDCVKIIDNNPYLFFVSKVAYQHTYNHRQIGRRSRPFDVTPAKLAPDRLTSHQLRPLFSLLSQMLTDMLQKEKELLSKECWLNTIYSGNSPTGHASRVSFGNHLLMCALDSSLSISFEAATSQIIGIFKTYQVENILGHQVVLQSFLQKVPEIKIGHHFYCMKTFCYILHQAKFCFCY